MMYCFHRSRLHLRCQMKGLTHSTRSHRAHKCTITSTRTPQTSWKIASCSTSIPPIGQSRYKVSTYIIRIPSCNVSDNVSIDLHVPIHVHVHAQMHVHVHMLLFCFSVKSPRRPVLYAAPWFRYPPLISTLTPALTRAPREHLRSV